MRFCFAILACARKACISPDRYMCKCEHVLQNDGDKWSCANVGKTILDVCLFIGVPIAWLVSVLCTILPTAILYAELVNYAAGPYLICSKGPSLMRGAAPWKILLVYAGASLFLWLVFKAVDVAWACAQCCLAGHYVGLIGLKLQGKAAAGR